MQLGLGIEIEREETDTDRCWTPKPIVDGVARALGGAIDTDPCWHHASHVRAGLVYDGGTHGDGLTGPWRGRVYMNPPFSSPLLWVMRWRELTERAIALVRLDPTTEWWREHLFGPDSSASPRPRLGLARERVKFGGYGKGGTPPFMVAFAATRDLSPALLRDALPMADWWDAA